MRATWIAANFQGSPVLGDKKVSVWSTVGASYRFVLRRPGALMRVGWLPLLLLFLVDLAAGGALPGIASLVEEPVRARLAELILTFFTQTVIAVVLLVAWHRVVMLDQGETAAMVGLGVGRREIRYLGFWVLLSAVFAAALVLTYLAVLAGGFAVLVVAKLGFVIAGAVELPPLGRAGQFTLLSVAGFLCGMMVAVYVSVRLSLVLPAIATDQGRPLIEAWRLSRNNGWRLAAASILVLLPPELVSLAATAAAHSAAGTLMLYPAAALHATCFVILIVSTGTVLSLLSLAVAGRDAAYSTQPSGVLGPA